MTIPNVSEGQFIDLSWGNAVADQLNNLPAGVFAGESAATTDSNGITNYINFGVTFASPPFVLFTIVGNVIYAGAVRDTETTRFRCRLGDPSASTSANNKSGFGVRWVAIGTPV